MYRFLLLAALLLPVPGFADRPPPTDGTVEEHWYRLEIGGEPAGWMTTRQIRAGGRLTFESTVRLKLRRGAAEQEIEIASGTVETAEGRPVRAWTRQRLGAAPTETRYEFLAGEILVTTSRGGGETTERRPWPAGEWLMPGRAEDEVRRRLASGATSFRLRTLDPELGIEPVEVEWTLEAGGVEIEAAGRRYLTRRFRQTASVAPGLASLVHLADDGLLVRMSAPLLGLELTATLASRETALAASGAPDLLTPTFIRPDRPIADPRRARRAVYELSIDGGEPPELPATGHQRVEAAGVRPSGPGAPLRVVVDLDAVPEPAGVGGPDSGDFLRSSLYVDHRHPRIRRLLAEAGGEVAARSDPAPPAAARAEAMRAFVGGYLADKNLEALLATASEVAESRAGDCTEHSVLLAALLRADGIPSRLVAGLVYVDDFLGARRIFGYHMWVQARIAERWIDLDPSFEEPFDATHIAFATTALNDGATAARELARIAPLLGRTEIRVLEVEHRAE